MSERQTAAATFVEHALVRHFVRRFAARMNRFYQTATEVLIRHDAIIDKLVGDEVMALFIPGICGG